MSTTKAQPVLARFEVKAINDEARTFTGLASTWDLDLGGDVIEKGAFAKTLREWKRKGRSIPLIDQHNYMSVRSVVGKMTEAKETDEGLLATFEVIEGADGDEVWRRLKGGYVDGLSIGYRATLTAEPSDDQRKKGVWRIIKELDLREVSVVVWPMNTAARIDPESIKAALALVDDEKELRGIASHIGSLLRPKPPASEEAAEAKDEQETEPPDASPSTDDHGEADTQKGVQDEPEYLYTEALQHRLLRLRISSRTMETLQ